MVMFGNGVEFSGQMEADGVEFCGGVEYLARLVCGGANVGGGLSFS